MITELRFATNIDALSPGELVNVRVAPSGAWVIHDERDHCGGRFRNREAAIRYIRRQFGTNVRLKFLPWPGLTTAHAA